MSRGWAAAKPARARETRSNDATARRVLPAAWWPSPVPWGYAEGLTRIARGSPLGLCRSAAALHMGTDGMSHARCWHR
jgi:hypothetical protein